MKYIGKILNTGDGICKANTFIKMLATRLGQGKIFRKL